MMFGSEPISSHAAVLSSSMASASGLSGNLHVIHPVIFNSTGTQPVEDISKISGDARDCSKRIKKMSLSGLKNLDRGAILIDELEKSTNKHRERVDKIMGMPDVPSVIQKEISEMCKCLLDDVAKFDEINGYIEAAKTLFTSIVKESKTITEFMVRLVTMHRDLELKVEQLSTSREEDKKYVEKLHADLDELRDSFNNKCIENKSLENKVTRLDMALEEQCKDWKSKVSKLEEQCKEQGKELIDWKSKVSKLEEQGKEQGKELIDWKSKISKLKDQLSEEMENYVNQVKLSLSDKDYGKLVLRQVVVELPTLLAKIIFPDIRDSEAFLPYRYIVKRLNKEMKENLAANSEAKKVAVEEKQKKLEELLDVLRPLGWVDDFDTRLCDMKEFYALNSVAHPDLTPEVVGISLHALREIRPSVLLAADVGFCENVEKIWMYLFERLNHERLEQKKLEPLEH